MNYSQKRMDTLVEISHQHVNFTTTTYDDKTSSIHIQNNSLDYRKSYPDSFITNHHRLNYLLLNTQNKKNRSKIVYLISRYNATIQKIIGKFLKQRKKYLKRYLDQTRYFQAHFYDKTNETAN